MKNNNQVTLFNQEEGKNAFSMPNLIFNPQSMQMLNQYADMLSSGGLVPAHFQGKPGDLMAVIIQSERWGIDHVAVAQSTFVLNGKLGYESKLLQAVCSSLAGISFEGKTYGDWSKIKGNIKKETKKRQNKQTKEWYEVQVDVQGWNQVDEIGVGYELTAIYPDGTTKTIRVDLNTCYPRNSTNWIYDPETQIHYRAISRFTRRHEPGLIAGIRTRDDIPLDNGPIEKEINPTHKPKQNTDINDIINGDVKENANENNVVDDADYTDINNIYGDDEVISKFQEMHDLICQAQTKEECSSYRSDIELQLNNEELSQSEFDDLKSTVKTRYYELSS